MPQPTGLNQNWKGGSKNPPRSTTRLGQAPLQSLLQLSSSAGGENKVGRFHLVSQHIWPESVKRMKRETFCLCLLAPVGTACISKSFILLKLPVATRNLIVWQMKTKWAQGRSDSRALLYAQLSSVPSAERYHIWKEWKSWRNSSSNWEKGRQTKWQPLYKGHFFSCHPHKWTLKLMQAIAVISEAGSSGPCEDGSENGSLGLMQPLYMIVQPILPSVFCASHFFFLSYVPFFFFFFSSKEDFVFAGLSAILVGYFFGRKWNF